MAERQIPHQSKELQKANKVQAEKDRRWNSKKYIAAAVEVTPSGSSSDEDEGSGRLPKHLEERLAEIRTKMREASARLQEERLREAGAGETQQAGTSTRGPNKPPVKGRESLPENYKHNSDKPYISKQQLTDPERYEQMLQKLVDAFPKNDKPKRQAVLNDSKQEGEELNKKLLALQLGQETTAEQLGWLGDQTATSLVGSTVLALMDDADDSSSESDDLPRQSKAGTSSTTSSQKSDSASSSSTSPRKPSSQVSKKTSSTPRSQAASEVNQLRDQQRQQKKEQRKKIYTLNDLMKRFEHTNFIQFCREYGIDYHQELQSHVDQEPAQD